MERQHWQDRIITIVGVWLMASPWALGYIGTEVVPTGIPAWTFVAAGVLTFLFNAAALMAFRWRWKEWVDMAIALLLGLSPWALQFSQRPTAMWNAVVCAVVIFGSALWVLMDGKEGKRT